MKANNDLVNLLYQLTIDKAKKEGRDPFEVLGDLQRLIKQKRTMERQRIIQVVEGRISAN